MVIKTVGGIWNLHDVLGSLRWAVMVSELRSRDSQQRCPSCLRALSFGFRDGAMRPKHGLNMEVLNWQGRCQCEAELIIFNDSVSPVQHNQSPIQWGLK